MAGPDHPRWKTGDYSRYWDVLPQGLSEAADVARQDENLLSLEDEVVLLRAMIRDALKRMERGDAGDLWLELRDLWNDFATARRQGQVEEMDAILERIGRWIQRGATDTMARREIRDMTKDLVRVSESERKRLVEINAMLDARAGVAFVQKVLLTVEKHVQDRRSLAAIATDLQPLLSPPPG